MSKRDQRATRPALQAEAPDSDAPATEPRDQLAREVANLDPRFAAAFNANQPLAKRFSDDEIAFLFATILEHNKVADKFFNQWLALFAG